MQLASCSPDLSHVLQMVWGTKWRHFSLNAWLSLKPGALQQTALSGNGWGVFPLVLLWLPANFHFLALQVGNGVYPTMRWKRAAEPEKIVLKSIWGWVVLFLFFFSCSSIPITVFCFLFFGNKPAHRNAGILKCCYSSLPLGKKLLWYCKLSEVEIYEQPHLCPSVGIQIIGNPRM